MAWQAGGCPALPLALEPSLDHVGALISDCGIGVQGRAGELPRGRGHPRAYGGLDARSARPRVFGRGLQRLSRHATVGARDTQVVFRLPRAASLLWLLGFANGASAFRGEGRGARRVWMLVRPLVM